MTCHGVACLFSGAKQFFLSNWNLVRRGLEGREKYLMKDEVSSDQQTRSLPNISLTGKCTALILGTLWCQCASWTLIDALCKLNSLFIPHSQQNLAFSTGYLVPHSWQNFDSFFPALPSRWRPEPTWAAVLCALPLEETGVWSSVGEGLLLSIPKSSNSVGLGSRTAICLAMMSICQSVRFREQNTEV